MYCETSKLKNIPTELRNHVYKEEWNATIVSDLSKFIKSIIIVKK